MNFTGQVPVGSGRTLSINTQTGEGVKELIKLMKPFVRYHASNLDFPGYGKEDLEQEMFRMAFEALPRYQSDKKANLLTFLQNHIKNRTINMCKFFAEKRRNASYLVNQMVKVRCNTCRIFFKGKTDAAGYTCRGCGASGPVSSDLWRMYNIAIIPQQFTAQPDADWTPDVEISHDNSHFAAVGNSIDLSHMSFKMDLEKIASNESETNKSIISLLCQGYNRFEIAKRLSLTPRQIADQFKEISQRLGGILEDTNVSIGTGG